MKTSTYLFKEGYDNLKKHGSKSLSTIIIICATMLILGIFIILLANINKNVNAVKVEQGFQAFITEGTKATDIEYMKDQIIAINCVKEVKYLTKDMAYEDAKKIFKDQSYFIDGMDKLKPFAESFVVTFTDINLAENIKNEVEKIDGIYKVKYNKTTIDAVITISKIANIFLLAIGSVMLIISIFIISNTIKLAVYSNKREIYIMKYIGATNKFIRAPFIVEGAIMGLISAIFSFITISIGYILIYARLPEVGTSLGIFGFIPYSEIWYYILAIFVILGLLIGIIGSSISMRKYLKV
ncbi:MAG: permease-like cell division protein FtsX [Clostridia bacterium]